jgi:hypothetical protein
MDASQEQTDVDSFAPLEPTADGFRNYLRGKQRLSAEELLDRHRQNLGFVVARARQWRRDIEECTKPCRPEMDVDLIGPDVDALDQAGEDGTLACSRQLGPALPDLGDAGDEPALRREIRTQCRLVDIAGIEKPLSPRKPGSTSLRMSPI